MNEVMNPTMPLRRTIHQKYRDGIFMGGVSPPS
jgi:hypothetical protein